MRDYVTAHENLAYSIDSYSDLSYERSRNRNSAPKMSTFKGEKK